MAAGTLIALANAAGLQGVAAASALSHAPTSAHLSSTGPSALAHSSSCPASHEQRAWQPERDHSLFQLDLTALVPARSRQAVPTPDTETSLDVEARQQVVALHDCAPALISRRRRIDKMCSCRRRSGSSSLPDGWRCDGAQDLIVQDAGPTPAPAAVIGWKPSDIIKGQGHWCEVNIPQSLNLRSCPAKGSATLKVLTYNLFWWSLFQERHGNGQSAGRKIAETSGPEQYDVMGFQECDDVDRVLGDAHNQGLAGEYELINGGHALAAAWRKSRFTWLAEGKEDVGEDHPDQYYGKRAAQWVRLRHNDGQTIFFVNHHGPLPVSRGGGCTGSSTAFNILKLIATHASATDIVILVGDFNAEAHSSRIQTLDSYIDRVFSGTRMNGVDHIYSNCPVASTANLGTGGSDHDALSVSFTI